jgi:Hemerythrin HHE cation binding domain
MSDLTEASAQAIEQPHGDVITILLEQHQRIRELFTDVKRAEGSRKQQAFDELRILLAVHETAEEMVLRPVSCQDAGAAVAGARNQEEREATRMLAVLEARGVRSHVRRIRASGPGSRRARGATGVPAGTRPGVPVHAGRDGRGAASRGNDRADPPASLDCGLADRAVDDGAVGFRDRPGPGRDQGRHAAKLTAGAGHPVRSGKSRPKLRGLREGILCLTRHASLPTAQ